MALARNGLLNRLSEVGALIVAPGVDPGAIHTAPPPCPSPGSAGVSPALYLKKMRAGRPRS
jgi:hypothetical protein